MVLNKSFWDSKNSKIEYMVSKNPINIYFYNKHFTEWPEAD